MKRQILTSLALCSLIVPEGARAGTNDLFKIEVAVEAIQKAADTTLPTQPKGLVKKAKKSIDKALQKIMQTNERCPEKPDKADKKLVQASRQLVRFQDALCDFPESDEINGLLDVAENASADTDALHLTGEVCDQGSALQGETPGNFADRLAMIAMPSDIGAESLFGELSLSRITPFVNFGSWWGTLFGSAHGTLGVFGAGQASPPHTHSGTYYGVVLSGTIKNPFGTEDSPPALPASSFWSVPAEEQHVTKCELGEPCLFYFHSRDAFDFAVLDAGVTEPRSDVALSIPGADLNFVEISPFAQFATVWGDRESGPHGTFGNFNPESASPLHTHSVAYHGIVISGTLINPFNGETDPVPLTTGSYWFVPAGVPHVTACISDESCRFYFHAEGAFDFLLTEE